MLGVPGAIVADLLMQLFGMAALALLLPLAIWGWRLVTHRTLRRERIRLCFWVAGVLLAAACASSLPRNTAWPLPAGLGGVVGDWMLLLPAFVSGKGLSGVFQATVAIATGTGALLCCAIAAGFGLRGGGDAGDEDHAGASEQEGGLISLGWVVHGFLSIKTRVERLLARTPWLRSEDDRAPASGRAEPHFGGRSTPVDPPVDPEGEEDEEAEEASEAAPAPRKPRAASRTARRVNGGYVLPPLELLAVPKA